MGSSNVYLTVNLCANYMNDVLSYNFTNSVSNNFRLELIKPPAREVEGQQFYSSDSVSRLARFAPCSLLLSSFAPALHSRSKIKYLSSRRLYKLQVKISGHAVHDYQVIEGKDSIKVMLLPQAD